MIKTQKKPLFYGHKILLLTALEFVLAFSGLGFVHYGSATIMYIPVIAAAYFYGIRAGVLLGAVFGITSIWEASMAGIDYFDSLFSPFSSGNIAGSIYTALGARMLFGFASGVLFTLFKNVKINEYVKVTVLSITAQLIHILLVLIPMGYLFPKAHIDEEYITGNIFSVSEILQIILLTAIMCVTVYISKNKRLAEIEKILDEGRQSYYTKRLKIEGAFFVLFLLSVILALMFHLHDMTIMVVNAADIELPFQTRIMFINIQIQFLIGVAAISYIIGIFITSYRVYAFYHINNADKDLMTGLYSKTTAVDYGATVINNKKDFPDTYFIMIDIDNFKGINDTYGHLTGDNVIINIARFLEKHFGAYGLVSRFGGDEFVVFITRSLNKNDIERKIHEFQSDAASISLEDNRKVTCSIGVCHVDNEKKFDEVYRKADEALYQVKTAGRNGYRFYKKSVAN